MRTPSVVVLSALVCLAALPALGQQERIVPLGSLGGGPYSAARAVNDSGVVSGVTYDANWTGVPFVWTATAGMVALESDPLAGTNDMAHAINNAGQIAGHRSVIDGSGNWRVVAMLWLPKSPGSTDHAGHVLELPFTTSAYAFAINSSGQIAGTGKRADGTWRAFRWTPHFRGAATGTVELLEPILGRRDTVAKGINSRGEVVGDSGTMEGDLMWLTDSVGAVWSRRNEPRALLAPAPQLTGSVVFGINDSGEVVGAASDANWSSTAAVWRTRASSDGPVIATLLGTLDVTVPEWRMCMAFAINNEGTIVGHCDDPRTGFTDPTYWKEDGSAVNLYPGGDGAAWAINGRGQIVGEAWLGGAGGAYITELGGR